MCEKLAGEINKTQLIRYNEAIIRRDAVLQEQIERRDFLRRVNQ